MLTFYDYPEKWATSSKGTSAESARFHFSGKRVNQACGLLPVGP